MRKKTYLAIEIHGEENLGIIDAGVVPNTDIKKIQNYINNVVEPKLVEALESHFDCEVKIVAAGEITASPLQHFPLELKYNVVVCSLDEDYNEEVFLTNTFIW